MVSLAIASRLVPRVRGRPTGQTKGVLVKETQQPTMGGERGAPDLARAPLVRAPVEPRVYWQLFDRETLAEYLRLSTDTIDRLVKANKLRCIRIGHQVRFTLDDVDAFVEHHRTRESESR
jgi:excisionase family DNA binding protein